MRDIRIATCSRCVRSVGENKAFAVEFVPKGEPEGCEWRGGERGSLHPLQMGAGVRGLLQKVLFLLKDLAFVMLEELDSSKAAQCIYCSGEA
jgi:hypothetical protein